MEIRIGLIVSKDLMPYQKDVQALEAMLAAHFKQLSFGPGIRQVYLGVLLQSSGAFIRPKKPKFFPGRKQFKGEFGTYETEDALEFEILVRGGVIPNFSAAIDQAIERARESVLELQIPEFDARAFLDELQSRIARPEVTGPPLSRG